MKRHDSEHRKIRYRIIPVAFVELGWLIAIAAVFVLSAALFRLIAWLM